MKGGATQNELFKWAVNRELSEREFDMSRRLLMQSVLGHLALLAEKHPKKAASVIARRAKRYAQLQLTARQAKPLAKAA